MKSPAKRFSVYVIALDKEVLKHKKFCDQNPQYRLGKPCVYVGMTALTPDERFSNHKNNKKSNKYARKYGKYLRRKLYEKYNPMTYEEAGRRERLLAAELRRKGYAVYQK